MGFFSRLFGGGDAESKPPVSTTAPAGDQAKQYFLRGVSLLQNEQIDEALASFDKAIELQPNNFSAWHWKGVTLDVLGKPMEAIVCFEQAIRILPRDPMPYLDKGK